MNDANNFTKEKIFTEPKVISIQERVLKNWAPLSCEVLYVDI